VVAVGRFFASDPSIVPSFDESQVLRLLARPRLNIAVRFATARLAMTAPNATAVHVWANGLNAPSPLTG
jgi:hypothetical protein